jgi:hypothetical protein
LLKRRKSRLSLQHKLKVVSPVLLLLRHLPQLTRRRKRKLKRRQKKRLLLQRKRLRNLPYRVLEARS